MKKITGLVVILAAIILGGYYGMGVVTERTLKKSVDIINQSTGVTVAVVTYNRHWFTSDATLDVRVHTPERVVPSSDGKSKIIPENDYTMDVPVKITHGPIIYSKSGIRFGLGYAQSHLSLPKELADKFSTLFAPQATQPSLDLSIFVNYSNKSRFQVDVPPFKLVSKDGAGEADWLGMAANVSVSSNLDHVSGSMTLDGVNFSKEQLKGKLGSVTSDYNLRKTTDGLYLGEAGISLPTLVITQDNKTIFDLADFKARTESDISDGLFESDFKTSLDKIISNDKQYGPALLEMSIKNLDADALARINAQASKMKQTSGAERQQLMFAMLPELPKLFAKGASFEVSTLKLTVPEGDVDGHFMISLPKSENINPFQLMQKVEGEGKVQVPAAIVKKVLTESLKQKAMAQTSPQNVTGAPVPTANQGNPSASDAAVTQQATAEVDKKLAALVEAKLLIQQGQNYVVEFQLSEGKLTINGQPFDPATFTL